MKDDIKAVASKQDRKQKSDTTDRAEKKTDAKADKIVKDKK